MDILGHYNYWVAIALMMMGLFLVIERGNLVKKLVGLNILQTAVFLLYITMSKVAGGPAAILTEGFTDYSTPWPPVLILTAMGVAVATTAVGLAIIVRIRYAYGTIEEDDIMARDGDE